MATPRLIFHVGHPKTGTSALQSSFALSTQDLRAVGLHYPLPRTYKLAKAGRITSGNLNAARVLERYHAERGRAPVNGAILMSNEAGFRIFPDTPELLAELRDDGVAIDLIMFIRNPVGLARSIYAQMVQRHGHKGDFETFFAQFSFLDRVERFLECADALGLPVAVRNYSDASGGVLGLMEDVLWVPAGTLTPAPGGLVNRSLTRAEIEAVRVLNDTHGADAARAVGDAWVEKLPSVAPDRPWLSPEAHRAYAHRVAPQIAQLNLRLPDGVNYRIEPYETVFGSGHAPIPLTEAHHDIMAKALAAWKKNPGPGLRERIASRITERSPGLAKTLRHVRDRLPR